MNKRGGLAMILGMTIAVTHVVHRLAHEDTLRWLAWLLRVVPAERVRSTVLAVGMALPEGWAPPGVRVRTVHRRFGSLLMEEQDRAELLATGVELVHAWGADAAAVVGPLVRGLMPVLTTFVEAGKAEKIREGWPLRGRSVDVPHLLCASRSLMARLQQEGLPAKAMTLLPACVGPGAAEPNKEGVPPHEHREAVRARVRGELGLPAEARVVLTTSPPSRSGGQYVTAWAVAVLRQIWPDLYLIVPGRSREQERIRRMVEAIICPEAYRLVEYAYASRELLAAADVLVMAADADVPIYWLALAQAAGVPVLGSPHPSLADWIRDGETGFTVEAVNPHALAVRLREVLSDPAQASACADRARQALAQQYGDDPTTYAQLVERHLTHRPKPAAVV